MRKTLFGLAAVAAVAVLLVGALRIQSDRQIADLRAGVLDPGSSVPPSLTSVPEPLIAFAEQSHLSVPSGAVALRLLQRGEMQLQDGEPWRAFTAEQWVSLRKPAFIWVASIAMMPGLSMRIIDAFDGRHGVLDVRLAGALPVASVSNEETDVAQAQRYLAELPWAPGALRRNPRLRYSALPGGAVRVSTEVGGRLAEVDLRIDALGRVSGAFAAARARTIGTLSLETPWGGEFSDWPSGGTAALLPQRGEAAWLSDSGPAAYFRGEIVALEALNIDGEVIKRE